MCLQLYMYIQTYQWHVYDSVGHVGMKNNRQESIVWSMDPYVWSTKITKKFYLKYTPIWLQIEVSSQSSMSVLGSEEKDQSRSMAYLSDKTTTTLLLVWTIMLDTSLCGITRTHQLCGIRQNTTNVHVQKYKLWVWFSNGVNNYHLVSLVLFSNCSEVASRSNKLTPV
jgi:hypothetical protein